MPHRTIMFRRCLLCKITFVSLLLLPCISTAEEPPSFIHIVAEGKANAQPDQAELQLSFTTTHLEVEQARSIVDQQVETLLKKLSQFELDTASLNSSQTQIHPQYDYRNQQQQFIGYQVNRHINFILNDLKQLDKLIQTITESKISRLNRIQFGLSNSAFIKEEALSNAIRQSKRLAKQIADAYDVKLGKIHRVSHRPESEHSVMRAMTMNAELARDDANHTYQQKDLEFKATIDVAFDFH